MSLTHHKQRDKEQQMVPQYYPLKVQQSFPRTKRPCPSLLHQLYHQSIQKFYKEALEIKLIAGTV